jgi:glucose 1-dehydrogenase
MSDFAGRVALVTGAGGGMGRATARAFAAAGAAVVAVDTADTGQETADLILADGGRSSFVRADVSDSGAVREAVAAAMEGYDGLHCAVNAAAIERETTLLADCDEATFDLLFAVNVRSVFLCMKYEIPAMLASGGGAIVNIASTNSFRPRPKQSTYTATKHAVVGLTKTAAIEYAGQGIRINAIAPGAVDTPMLRGAMAARGSKEADVVRNLSLVGRLGSPEEIAAAALWLCSPASSYTVGHVLAVDGGYLAR